MALAISLKPPRRALALTRSEKITANIIMFLIIKPRKCLVNPQDHELGDAGQEF
ncbi:hypothetical protein E2C01_054737 [Portunus trituberculatus]|uniref:Uncharacterized protein n=1 Tax=Portunus trituberculatus TaxID=210409 RepID=A0A5B7GKM4_PORTR|nr:hypothetical protein [Portunus trituberculatus]